jgi:hypothetical protein
MALATAWTSVMVFNWPVVAFHVRFSSAASCVRSGRRPLNARLPLRNGESAPASLLTVAASAV